MSSVEELDRAETSQKTHHTNPSMTGVQSLHKHSAITVHGKAFTGTESSPKKHKNPVIIY